MKVTRITLYVTQANIDNCRELDAFEKANPVKALANGRPWQTFDPIAMAFARSKYFKHVELLRVGYNNIWGWVVRKDQRTHFRIALPVKVHGFISEWERDEEVLPFRFRVSVRPRYDADRTITSYEPRAESKTRGNSIEASRARYQRCGIQAN